jgi:hypothetical protein
MNGEIVATAFRLHPVRERPAVASAAVTPQSGEGS